MILRGEASNHSRPVLTMSMRMTMCELLTKQGAMCDGEEGEADQSQLINLEQKSNYQNYHPGLTWAFMLETELPLPLSPTHFIFHSQ